MSDKKSMAKKQVPLLPLRDVIIFPHMVVPLFVGREKSIAALEEASKRDNELFLVTQKDSSVLNPDQEDKIAVRTYANFNYPGIGSTYHRIILGRNSRAPYCMRLQD